MANSAPRAVVLLSGGLDSTANFFRAVLEDEVALAITIDYGQRSARAEVRAASRLAETFGVRHEIVALPWLGALGGSALTSAGQMPQLSADSLDERGATEASARAVWVPNRNGAFIHVAAAFAESLGASRVLVGFNREEAQTFPDNSGDYLRAVTAALRYSTANHVEVFCYTTELDKTEIVREIGRLESKHGRKFPWELLWSCYEAGPSACGTCESCLRLARARRQGEAS